MSTISITSFQDDLKISNMNSFISNISFILDNEEMGNYMWILYTPVEDFGKVYHGECEISNTPTLCQIFSSGL